MAKKAISYSEAINEIEDILTKMENEELDVDDLSVKVKRVSELIALCRDKLYKTEKDVENVLKDMDKDKPETDNEA